MADMKRKGRAARVSGTRSNRVRFYGSFPKGEGCSYARLTEENVVFARQAHADGAAIGDLARMFNVDWSTMRKAVLRINWKHVK